MYHRSWIRHTKLQSKQLSTFIDNLYTGSSYLYLHFHYRTLLY